MYERCISTCSSTGSMRPLLPGCPNSMVLSVTGCLPVSYDGGLDASYRLDVEEPDVLRVALDERPALLDVLAHQHGEHLVGLRRVLEGDLQQEPVVGVHRGLPQLVGVHLAEP